MEPIRPADVFRIVHVTEAVQAGDVFLLHFRCPGCRARVFDAYPVKACPECRMLYLNATFESPSRQRQRLLSGTRRRSRRYIPIKTIRALEEQQEGHCAYCFTDIRNNYEVEHIVPLCVGGSNDVWNLCLSCKICNRLAGKKFFNSQNEKRAYVLAVRTKRAIFIEPT